jgi:hypothetical protein
VARFRFVPTLDLSQGIGPPRTSMNAMDRHSLYYRISLVWLAIMVACLVLVLLQ